MIYEKSWQFDINRVQSPQPATALSHSAYQMWLWKQALTGGPPMSFTGSGLWTMFSSSNSVTASQLDNLGSSSFTASNWVQAAAGSVHSWFILKSPAITVQGTASNFYMYVNYSGAPAAPSATIINFSKAVPAGNSSTSICPTASSDIWNIPSQAIGTQFGINDASTSVNVRTHTMLATDGSFIFLHSKDASAVWQQFLSFQVLADTRSLDQYPVWTGFDYASAGVSMQQSGRQGYCDQGWNLGRNFNGSAVGPCPVVTPIVLNVGTPNDPWNQVTANVTFVSADQIDNTLIDWPIYVYWTPVTAVGGGYYKGRVQDMARSFSLIANLPNGTVEPSNGTPKSMNVQGMWIPTNTAPTL